MKNRSTIMKKKLLYGLFLPFLMMPFFLNAQWVFEITSPAELAGQYPVGTASFGATVSDTLNGTLAAGEDDSMNPTLGCETLTTDLTGSIGLLDRGECAFNIKAENAQNAGATALIVANSSDEIVNMPGSNPNVTIPSFLIQQSLSNEIRAALESGNVEISIFEIEQEVIWGGPNDPNSTFDGGLNDWTSVGLLCSPDAQGGQVDDTNAEWRWEANPSSQGAFWGTRGPFNSPTAANGAVIFDSDFLDNNGDPNGFMTGSCPAPQRAELISPVIDLSGETSLVLSFHQYYRRFGGPGGSQAEVASYVEVSGDNGETWTRFTTNTDIVVNSETGNATRTLVDISDVAGGSSEVLIKFVWDGEYYFWMIDDVAITQVPETNVSITETFNPLSAFATPADHIATDSFGFRVNFINEGLGVDSILCEVQVINADNNNILHQQTEILTNLQRGRDTLIFQDLFPPEIETLGNYLIRYRIDPLNSVDLDYTDNFESYAFQITDEVYSMDDPSRTSVTTNGTSPPLPLPGNADSWVWGNVYYISEMPEPTTTDTFVPRFLGSEHIYVSPNGSFTNGEDVVVLLLEFAQPGRTYDFTGVVAGPGNADINTLPTFDHPGFNPIAFAVVDQDKLQSAGSGNLLQLQATDFIDAQSSQPITDDYIILDDDRLYFVVTQVSDDNVGQVRLGGVGSDLDAATSLLYWPDGQGAMRNYTGFTNSVPVARMRTDVALINSDESVITRDADFSVYPQPATDKMYLNLDLNEPSDVELEYINMGGQVVKTSKHQNISSQPIEEDVQTIQTGSYIIKVITKDGVKTTKIMVIK